jgi:glycosyltransferase involved in cell wall biosynthesis
MGGSRGRRLPMKICLATNQFASPFSGVGTYARALARGLVSAGMDVTVLCPADQVGRAPDLAFIPVSQRRWPSSHARWFILSHSFSRHLGKMPGFDIVHFLDAREALFYCGVGPTVVGTVHDYYFSSPRLFWQERAHYPDWVQRLCYATLVRALEPRAYRKARFLIMNSEATRQRISATYRSAETRSKTIHIGLEFDTVEPSTGERQDAVLFVGGNPYRKGLPRLMRAVIQLRRRWPRLELWVVGTSLPSPLRRLASRLLAQNALKVQPAVSVETLGERYQTARVFALPGRTEAFGLVFLEAMAHDCPVIGPEDGGAQEIIIDGQTGFLVPADRDDLLLLRLSQYLTDRSLCQEMAARAREQLPRFSSETMVRETRVLYETLLS